MNDATIMETISADVLRGVIERGEATAYLARVGRLVNAARAFLAAIEWRCDGNDRDVRIRDLWGAAWAAKAMAEALGDDSGIERAPEPGT